MDLQASVNAIPYWYHRIPLPGGVTTPGWAPLIPEAYRIPADLTGKRVLDVGAWDGFWSFEALRRGALVVTAIDDFSDTIGAITNADRSKQWQTFDLCREALGYDYRTCQRFEQSVYDVGFSYEVIFCFGVLYHLKHPLLALERLRSVCRGSIHIETAILDGMQSAYRPEYQYTGDECCMEFYPGAEYGKNHSNWNVGTLKCWAAMVEAAGFRDVESWKLTDTPSDVSQCRGFIRARV